jgi:hypothetical protein
MLEIHLVSDAFFRMEKGCCLDQNRPGQTNLDQTRPNQTNLDQTRPGQITLAIQLTLAPPNLTST